MAGTGIGIDTDTDIDIDIETGSKIGSGTGIDTATRISATAEAYVDVDGSWGRRGEDAEGEGDERRESERAHDGWRMNVEERMRASAEGKERSSR